MPLSLSFLFTHTPLPWAAILCLLLYRHNLSLLLHPSRERSSIRDWKQVFQYLEIPFEDSSASEESQRSKVLIILKSIHERYPNIKFYTFGLSSIAIFSIISSSAVILTGGPSFINSHYTFLVAAGLQFLSALPSIFLMQRRFGTFPSPPYRFHLKKSRAGSLLKYEDILRTL